MTQTFNVGHRSRFVTVTAWVFALLGLLATASALVQTAMVNSIPAQLALAGTPWPQPGLTRWVLGYLPWLVGLALISALATVAAAVGLMRRLEWARRVFIVLLAAAIVVNLGGLWLQQEVMLSLVQVTLSQTLLSPLAADVFGGFVTAARALAMLVTLAACGVLGWIAWHLTRPLVRQEFA